MFLLWMTTAFFLQFGYYGINNWMPSYLETEVHMNFKNLTSYMVGSYTAMILGKILAGYLADKFNRRAVFCIWHNCQCCVFANHYFLQYS